MRNADQLDEQGQEDVLAPQADLWVLVCGGIATALAFAAAFLASGGVGHAATPPTPAHSVTAHTSTAQACPSAVPGR